MGDTWLQRLVVRGPASDVVAFQRRVPSPEKPKYMTMRPVCRTQRLSFARLCALLPPDVGRRFAAEIEEPWDLVVEPLRRLEDGSAEITYKFQLSAFEPEDLIIAVSRLYRRLCFVSGCVAPNVDDQSSVLIHDGRSWRWRLPLKGKNAIWKAVPEETEENEDEVTWALAEADWKMMAEVVAHWQPRIDALLAPILKGHGARSSRATPRPSLSASRASATRRRNSG